MRESRVNIWTNPTTINANGTTNGPTIDLLADYTGVHLYGTSDYGLPFEVIVSNPTAGTGTQTVTFKVQESADGTNWTDAGLVGTITFSGGVFSINSEQKPGLGRAKLAGRIRTARRYGRLVAVASGFAGGASCQTQAWVGDGAAPRNDGRVY
jgi:hypothetical protein